MNRHLLILAAITLPFLAGAYVDECDCSPDLFGGGGNGTGGTGGSAKPMNGLFTAAVTEIEIEIDYQTGAAPYTGSEMPFGRLWDAFHGNVAAVFSPHPKTLYIDDELAEMEQLTDISGSSFDVGAILDIAERHRQATDTASRRTFYVVFLDGNFRDDEGVQPNVLGVSIGKTGVIAMFKPVIAASGNARRVVEQTTLIHEFGHAVGLVDNGVTAQNDAHRDDPHGAHCTDDKCIMYWLNERGGELSSFVGRNRLTASSVLFDQDCLNDLWEAAR